jgi:hypothetical protein
VQVLHRLRDAVRSKRPEKWQDEFFLHHDNAPSHTSLVVKQFLAEKRIPFITLTPQLPDLDPSDFWLFPTLKMVPRGHFSSIISQIPLDVILRIFEALIANRCLGPPGNCIDGVVHHEFIPPGQTVNGHFYVQVLHRLRKQFLANGTIFGRVVVSASR